jgi:hypothetical protein
MPPPATPLPAAPPPASTTPALPAPALEPADVWRYEGPPGGCGSGVGSLTVRLAWPADARAGLDAVGFYFRVVEGEARAVGKPVRLAGDAIRAIAEPGSGA